MLESAVISLIVGAANLSFYMFIDPLLRMDTTAMSREPTEHDNGTTRLIGIAFALSWLILLLAAVLDLLQVGVVEPHLLFTAIGLVLAAIGVVIRIVAMRTLGEFFTRTLQMREEHHVVSDGIYRWIRHPGYLADIILFGGSAIATSNLIGIVLILALLIPTFLRRIAAEERMLVDQLGEEYSTYMKRTKKLIPFLF